jgi:hypothetical protein
MCRAHPDYVGERHLHTHVHPGREPVTHVHEYPCCHRHPDALGEPHAHADGHRHAHNHTALLHADDDPAADTAY